MADFPDSIERQALDRAGKRCECTSYNCFHHTDRCTRTFGLRTHHKNHSGPDTLDNCEILCDACYRNAHRFGRHEEAVSESSEIKT